MSNYCITFQLNTPICFVDRPLFDGILAYCWHKEQHPGSQTTTFTIDESINFDGMPLEKHPDGWFYGSYMMFNPNMDVEYEGSWKKRWANQHDKLVSFKNKASGKVKSKKVRTNSGQFRSFNTPILLHDLREVWFFFRSNNTLEVERLVSKHLWGLGKKTSQGYGEIQKFEIKKVDKDPFAELIRPMPIALEKVDKQICAQRKINMQFTGWKPPYWATENQTWCSVTKRNYICNEFVTNKER